MTRENAEAKGRRYAGGSDLAAHLAVALAAHRTYLARNGMTAPDGLDVLVEVAAALTRGQHPSELAGQPVRRHSEPDHKALSYKEVAAMLGVSPSTVRRMVVADTLSTVRVGARGVRIPMTALDAYLAVGR